jgi:ABC-type multidrug transport system fused ATPase/permease subunit
MKLLAKRPQKVLVNDLEQQSRKANSQKSRPVRGLLSGGLLALVTTVTLMIGCEALQDMNSHPENTASTVVDSLREQREQTEEITDASGEIAGSLNSIDNEAEAILNDIALVPDDRNYNIDPTLDSIENSAEAIKEHVDDAEKSQVRVDEALEDLNSANARVAAAVGQIEELEDLVTEYEQSDREVRKEALENLHSFITLFFVIGFGMLVGGAFIAFWVNGRLGAIILAVGMLTVGFAAASQFYLEEIALVGLIVLIVGFLATIGVIGWMLLNGKRYEKAIEEIVELIEEMKEHLDTEERQEIFGRNGFASDLTSPMTKKIISQIKIKNNFKNLGKTKKKSDAR